MISFVWDEDKNKDNQKKHHISFEVAQEAFFDFKRIIFEDEKHSATEKRFFCIGKVEEKIITVRFTIRENKIRIFGAAYWRKGKKIYETR